MLCFLLIGLAARAQTGAPSGRKPSEYEAKAAYLFNFGLFVDWPAEKNRPQTPFVIGVLGEDPFKDDLEKTLEGEKVESRPLQIRRYQNVQEARGAHVLFISNSEKRNLPEILSFLRGSAVLTVSDMDGFCDNGGMMQFGKEGNRVQVVCSNLAAVEEEKLHIKPALLEIIKRHVPAKRR